MSVAIGTRASGHTQLCGYLRMKGSVSKTTLRWEDAPQWERIWRSALWIMLAFRVGDTIYPLLRGVRKEFRVTGYTDGIIKA